MLAAWWRTRLAGRPQGGLEVIGLALLAVLLSIRSRRWLPDSGSFAAIGVLIATDGIQARDLGRASAGAGRLRTLPARGWRALAATAPRSPGRSGT